MFDLQRIVKMNGVGADMNPDRMGFQICVTIEEKFNEIMSELNTLQGMSPIDSNHNGDRMMSIMRKAKIITLISTMHMGIGGEDLEFLGELRKELNDLTRESHKQLEDLNAKIARKKKAAGLDR